MSDLNRKIDFLIRELKEMKTRLASGNEVLERLPTDRLGNYVVPYMDEMWFINERHGDICLDRENSNWDTDDGWGYTDCDDDFRLRNPASCGYLKRADAVEAFKQAKIDKINNT